MDGDGDGGNAVKYDTSTTLLKIEKTGIFEPIMEPAER
jgi:hypothetical protein